jgi:hypothetical protein
MFRVIYLQFPRLFRARKIHGTTITLYIIVISVI